MRTTLAALAVFLMAGSAAADTSKAAEIIRERCEAKWGEDYRMQRYCRERQIEGANALAEYLDRFEDGTPEFRVIQRCSAKWSDEIGPDFRMVAYCVERQLEALGDLRDG